MARFSGTLVEDQPKSEAKKPRFSGKPVDAPEERENMLVEAGKNFFPSALQVVKDTVNPILHPIDTATGIKNLAGGVASKLGIMDYDESTADAMGAALAERYGGWDKLENTFRTDPAGLLSDIAAILTGGSVAAAKAPGMVGKAARLAGEAGELVDPLSLGVKATGKVVEGVGHLAARGLGVTTGSGGESILEMQRAGRAGNVDAVEQMRGNAAARDIVDDTRSVMDELVDERARQYDADMQTTKNSGQSLSFREPVRALRRAEKETTHKGIVVSEGAANAVTQMRNVMRQFANAQANTPYDFDRMKRRLNEVRDGFEQGSHGRKVVDNVNASIGDTIGRAVPEYGTAMRAYGNRTEAMRELSKTLSLGEKATTDTALRKILSLERSGVNTNFGGRAETAAEVFKRRPNLKGQIAGRLLGGWEPVGLARAATAMSLGAGTTAGLAFSNPALIPAALGGLLTASPRAVGETAYKVGQARQIMDKMDKGIPLTPAQKRLIRQSLTQYGRTDREAKEKKRYRTKP